MKKLSLILGLFFLFQGHVFAEISTHVLWNTEKTLAVDTQKQGKQTKIIIYMQLGQISRAIDISQVEGMNLGKLGLYRSHYYDRIETTPIAWINRDDGKFQVDIQTRVWKNGKRQTVKEYVVFDKDGIVYWR